jgi:hypothetical protein
MRCPRSWKTVLTLILSASLMGSVCGLGCIEKVANNFNPCGTILNCDPAEYDLMMNNWPDWDLDPTCTIPGQCGGVFPYNTSGDDTTTTTTTTTTTGSLFSYY